MGGRLGIRARLARQEAGFTVVELLVAVLVIATGLIATLTVFDSSRRLTTLSDKQEAAAHVAERELEAVVAQLSNTSGYNTIGLTTIPSHNTDSSNPNYYVTTGGLFQWDINNTSATEHFCAVTSLSPYTCSGGTVSPGPDPWTSAGVSGSIYRYVTWGGDDSSHCSSAGTVKSACSGTTDWKRITIAVTVSGPNAPTKPVLASTIVTDKTAQPGNVFTS